MKKQKINRNSLITLIIIIVFIIIISIVFTYASLKPTRNRYKYEVMGVYKYKNMIDTQNTINISLKNIDVLEKFSGELPVSTVTKKIKKIFLESIPDTLNQTQNMSEADLKKYYAENSKEIKEDLRINNEECFLNMIKNIKEINCDLKNDSETCEFISNEEISFKYTYSNGQSITCVINGRDSNQFFLEF